MEKLSVAIITKNNENHVERCLESLKWADEIIVLDGHSSDKTVAICQRYTDKIYQKEFESFPIERDYVLKKTSNRWVLSVDADMVFPKEFCDEVREVLKEPVSDGYRMRVLTIFLGREIRHCNWFNYRFLRLFNKEKGSYDLRLSVYDPFIIKTGEIGKLKNHVLHYQGESFIEYFGKMKRYSFLTALEYNTKKVVITPFNSVYYLFIKPILAFVHKYICKRGFLDGIQGFLVCTNSAISYYASYAALWDMQRKAGVEPQCK